jgi:basic membrane lipoprotein Med (substrate-binding protein (PBP1-ABC) superfamily)
LALMGIALALLFAGVSIVRHALQSYLDIAPRPAAEFVIACVVPRSTNDAWAASGYRGTQKIAQQLGAQDRLVVAGETERAMLRAMSNAAAAGADVVIGHGGQFVEPGKAIAPAFPKTAFVVVGQYAGNRHNLGAVSFRDEETGFLAGCLAAVCSSNRRVAYVGGVALPHMRVKAQAFINGARYVAPDMVATAVFVGSWVDTRRACAQGDALCAAGFDVLSVDGDAAGMALQQHTMGRCQLIPWVMNEAMANTATAGQIVQRPDLLVQYAVALIWRGQWQGRQYRLGVHEGVHDIILRDTLAGTPEGRRVYAARDALRRGDLDAER